MLTLPEKYDQFAKFRKGPIVILTETALSLCGNLG